WSSSRITIRATHHGRLPSSRHGWADWLPAAPTRGRPMRRCPESSHSGMILMHVAMSLDGFIAGPGHDMSWTGGAEYDTSSQLADKVARPTGAWRAGAG